MDNFKNDNIYSNFMRCPDCSSPDMRKHGAFYTCPVCGLSAKPWDLEKARIRARKELDDLEDEDPELAAERKRRQRIRYRNWYEGRQSVD